MRRALDDALDATSDGIARGPDARARYLERLWSMEL
jgi:hypothetical protein